MNKKLFLFVPLLLIALSAFMLPVATVNAAPTKNYLMAWGKYTTEETTPFAPHMFHVDDICYFAVTASWTGGGRAVGSGVFCDQTGSINVYLKVTEAMVMPPSVDWGWGPYVVLRGIATITCGQWAGTYSYCLDLGLTKPSRIGPAQLVLWTKDNSLDDWAFGFLTCGTVIALPPLA